MANPGSRLVVLAVSAATFAAFLGCASTPGELDLPPQTLTEAPTSTTEEEAALVATERPAPAAETEAPAAVVPAAATAPAKAQPPPSTHKHTVVIQSAGSSQVTPQTLQQASESERERRATAETPVAVITNRNLGELAEGGQITIIGAPAAATPAQGAATTSAATAGSPAAPGPPAAGAATTASASGAPSAGQAAPSPALAEEYWRGQALKIRMDWKTAVEAVDQLQSEVADLRRRFYEEDDPFYRDNEIKPAWDRALDGLQEAKAAAETEERKLTRFLEEGRRSGALPGWLREGIEFEPPPTADHSPAGRRRTDDPWEPKVLEEEPRDP